MCCTSSERELCHERDTPLLDVTVRNLVSSTSPSYILVPAGDVGKTPDLEIIKKTQYGDCGCMENL